MAGHAGEKDFPCSLTISIPFPSHRLAKAALRSLAVDEELSPLVKREFSLASPTSLHDPSWTDISRLDLEGQDRTVLVVHYKATTPRMLRVATNGFFESLNVIVQVMEELDLDVVHEKGLESLDGVQGIEQGMTGSGVGVET